MAELEETLDLRGEETKQINKKDILKLVGAGRVETIWKTLDAAAGQVRTAIEHLDSLITDGEEPVGLLAAMSVTAEAAPRRAARERHGWTSKKRAGSPESFVRLR